MTYEPNNPLAWPCELPRTWNGEGWIEIWSNRPFFWRGADCPEIHRDANQFWLPLRGGRWDLAGVVVDTVDDFELVDELLQQAARPTTLWFNSSTFRQGARIARPDGVETIVLARARDVTDLSVITHFSEIRSLYLGDIHATDLSPLAHLAKLESLALNNCESLMSLRPLLDIKRLRILDLRNGKFPDLHPIAELRMLEALGLPSYTNDDELDAIGAGCRRLKQLVCWGSFRLRSLRHLAGLPHLKALGLSGTHIEDFGFLSKLPGLRTIDLSNNQELGSLAPLATVPQLTRLDLGGCERLKDFALLQHMSQLRSLSLPMGITDADLRAISDGCADLERLDIGSPIGLDDRASPLDGAAVTVLRQLEDLHAWRPMKGIDSVTRLRRLRAAALILPPDCRDLSFLSPLQSLRRLTVVLNDGMVETDALSNLRDLHVLNVAYGPFDLRPLDSLQTLVILEIASCVPLVGTDVLERLPNVMLVSIRDTPLEKLWTVPTDSKLLSLNLVRTGINDLSGIAGAAYLRDLEIEDCASTLNIGVLAKMSNLVKLRLPNSKAKQDLSPLAGASRLAILNLDRCDWVKNADIKAIARMPRLASLSLDWNEGFADLSPLSRLTGLESLSLTGCTSITDIKPLERLPELRTLSLSGCDGVTDFRPLGRMKKLVELLLESTYVRDISFIRELPNLRYVDMTMSHDIEDISPLVGLRAKGCVVQIAERHEELEELDAALDVQKR